MIQVTKFAIPEIVFGQGSVLHLAQCALRLGAKRILLVSDQGLEQAGWVDYIFSTLRDARLDWVYFREVRSNPRDRDVHLGAQIYSERNADVIIALGGGSAIDAAKGIAAVAGNGGLISNFEGANRIIKPLPPMIAIPTNAGSGSDVSQFSIITDTRRQVKMSIISRSLVPNISIIDPLFLTTKPKSFIASSAIMALAHAIESYLSTIASPFTESQALKAISLIFTNLKEAMESKSLSALTNLCIASTSAGMSFSNAGLGIGHSLAHSLGGMFDIEHGKIHSVLLPEIMNYHLEKCSDKISEIGRLAIGPRIGTTKDLCRATIGWMRSFLESLGVPVWLRDVIPDDTQMQKVSMMAVNDACMLTTPTPAGWRDLLGICERVW